MRRSLDFSWAVKEDQLTGQQVDPVEPNTDVAESCKTDLALVGCFCEIFCHGEEKWSGATGPYRPHTVFIGCAGDGFLLRAQPRHSASHGDTQGRHMPCVKDRKQSQ